MKTLKRPSFRDMFPDFAVFFQQSLIILPIGNSKFSGLSNEPKFKEFESNGDFLEGPGQ